MDFDDEKSIGEDYAFFGGYFWKNRENAKKQGFTTNSVPKKTLI